jgi:hypothetical protein
MPVKKQAVALFWSLAPAALALGFVVGYALAMV